MPISESLSRGRYQFSGVVTPGELERLVGNPDVDVLQTDEPVPRHTWTTLNSVFFPRRPDVQLRVYGHYSHECDLDFARKLTSVRRFAADCLRRAVNVDAIGEMPLLQELSLGVWELESLEVLRRLPSDLVSLNLGAIRSKRPDIRLLSRFTKLHTLYIEGHSKGIEVVGDLAALQDLTLRSISLPNLAFVACLPLLWSLDIKLGSLNDLSGITNKASIKYLELWMVKGLTDLGELPSLTGLQNIYLQSLRRVAAIPNLTRLTQLRRVVLLTMKGVSDLNPLAGCPALEEIGIYDARHLSPDDLIPVLKSKSLTKISASLGSLRKNSEFEELRTKYGKAEFNQLPFEYR